MWATVGEVIMPGNPFDPSGSTAAKPPRAKETMYVATTMSACSFC